ncbi:MAG: cytochrome c biogenesis protein CcdA [Synechococcales bacterium]|nr:cytochrome c biogenesis protein CcdA [Synechococcales bacterium]
MVRFIGLALGTALIVLLVKQFTHLGQPLEQMILSLEDQYQQWFEAKGGEQQWLLPAAFVGGLIASVSPCILGLLPINLSYIGTLEMKSRWDALTKALWFVFGAITAFSVLGLFAALAAAVFVDFRGYVNVLVGAIVLLMGAGFAGWFHLPLPQMQVELPIPGAYGVGFTFALVSSPCASPVLFAVLAAAAATGSQLISWLTMVSYAIGYTMVIFLASLFTGLVKQSRWLLQRSQWVMRVGSLVLLLAGAYYIVDGVLWFFS